METNRKPFQGVGNIIRFNWHFYVLSLLALAVLFFLQSYTVGLLQWLILLSILGIVVTTFVSLLVSYYVYDLSPLYQLKWIDNLKSMPKSANIVNVNAGFDETSVLLKDQFPDANLTVLDFYDPTKHTEISIKRARKAYPPYPNTQTIATNFIPLKDNAINAVFAILSAHEIRNEAERIVFFKELQRVLQPRGQIVVTEHLRDTANFMAYNIGFFHFHSKSTWLKTFGGAELKVVKEVKTTPFISTFILEKNGTTS
ncbi:MAG: methyltransferase domain-containing protein [Chitinophagales bacterium]